MTTTRSMYVRTAGATSKGPSRLTPRVCVRVCLCVQGVLFKGLRRVKKGMTKGVSKGFKKLTHTASKGARGAVKATKRVTKASSNARRATQARIKQGYRKTKHTLSKAFGGKTPEAVRGCHVLRSPWCCRSPTAGHVQWVVQDAYAGDVEEGSDEGGDTASFDEEDDGANGDLETKDSRSDLAQHANTAGNGNGALAADDESKADSHQSTPAMGGDSSDSAEVQHASAFTGTGLSAGTGDLQHQQPEYIRRSPKCVIRERRCGGARLLTLPCTCAVVIVAVLPGSATLSATST